MNLAEVFGERLLGVRDCIPQSREEESGFVGPSENLEVVAKDVLRLRCAAEHQMDPGPGFTVLGLLHLTHFVQSFQPTQVGLKWAASEKLQVQWIDPILLGREFKEPGQALIKPKWDIFQDTMEKGVRQFVPKISPEMVSHPGKHLQLIRTIADPWLGNEVRPADREARVPIPHVPLIPILGVEQEDLDNPR